MEIDTVFLPSLSFQLWCFFFLPKKIYLRRFFLLAVLPLESKECIPTLCSDLIIQLLQQWPLKRCTFYLHPSAVTVACH